jgi:MYXO-CTERM domain-containing protein
MARRRGLGKKLKKLLPAVTVSLTAVPFAAWSPTASAFFPPLWGTSPPLVVAAPPVTPPPLIVAPPVAPPAFVPPPPPPSIVSPPTVAPPVYVSPPPPSHCDCSCTTPEPTTLVGGLLGLVAVAGYRLKRRDGKPDDAAAEAAPGSSEE